MFLRFDFTSSGPGAILLRVAIINYNIQKKFLPMKAF